MFILRRSKSASGESSAGLASTSKACSSSGGRALAREEQGKRASQCRCFSAPPSGAVPQLSPAWAASYPRKPLVVVPPALATAPPRTPQQPDVAMVRSTCKAARLRASAADFVCHM